MNYVNYGDVVSQLQAAGIITDRTLWVDSLSMVRCKVECDREKRGWYRLYSIPLRGEMYIVGSYGVWRGNDNGATKIELPKEGVPSLSADERAAIAARHKDNAAKASAMRAQEAARAAARASNAWRQYLPSGESDYLKRKGVNAHGVRFSPTGNGTFAVPMTDTTGQIFGLQIIRDNPRKGQPPKQYWPKGMVKIGKYHLIGSPNAGGVLVIAEGYATAATLHESTGLPVAVAFDAGSLMPVANALHKSYPRAHIIIAADDDYLTDGNPGVTAARNAALSVGGMVAIPKFPDRGGKKLTDFNDLAQMPEGGIHLVRTQIDQAIKDAGWRITARAAVAQQQGGGETVALSIMPLDDIVARFIPVDDGTGKYVFDTLAQRIAHRDQMISLMPAGVRMDAIKMHPQWIQRGAVFVEQIGFDPTGADASIKCNLWKGWPTIPKAGDCTMLISLLRHLCSGTINKSRDGQKVDEWVIKWLAYPIQHPGAKMHTAVIVHGGQGSGKSRFFEAVGKIYGDHSIVLNQGALEDKFNSDWTSKKLFVIADEVVARSEMYQLKNQLKNLITSEWVRVNPKNLAAHREKNQMNFVFLSNEEKPAALEGDDRRHCVIRTPPKLNPDFYEELNREIDNGGIEALHHFLLNFPLGDFKPYSLPPETKAKNDLIEINRESIQAFFDDWLQGELGLPVCVCRSADLYAAYVQWSNRNGYRFYRNVSEFTAYTNKLDGWQRGFGDCYDNYHMTSKPKRTRLIWPSEVAIAEAKKLGIPTLDEENEQSRTRKNTLGALKFAEFLRNGGESD